MATFQTLAGEIRSLAARILHQPIGDPVASWIEYGGLWDQWRPLGDALLAKNLGPLGSDLAQAGESLGQRIAEYDKARHEADSEGVTFDNELSIAKQNIYCELLALAERIEAAGKRGRARIKVGLVEPDTFVFDGKSVKLSGFQFRLLQQVYGRRGGQDVQTVIDAVWGHETTDNAIKQLVKMTNAKLDKVACPQTVSYSKAQGKLIFS